MAQSEAVKTATRRARNTMTARFALHPRPNRAGFGSPFGPWLRLTIHAISECFFLSEVRFDLLRIGVIVRQRRVNLSETEAPVLRRNLFRSQAHFVPGGNTHHGHTRSGNLRPSRSNRRIAVDQTSNLNGANHSSIITSWPLPTDEAASY